MIWQLLLVTLLVAVAAAYLARRAWRSWAARKGGCGGGCGCAATAAPSNAQPGAPRLIPPEEIGLRVRRGPQGTARD